MPQYDFTGNVAYVSAGASGIGEATVQAFVEAGASPPSSRYRGLT